jgi:flagellin
MPIVVNSNASATSASFNLSRANDSLRSSLERLSSGKKINRSGDDAGGLAVAYKLESVGKRTKATVQNVQNALSYLQVQDGAMKTVGKIFNRIAQLRVMADDITKNSGDVENYSKEFVELQIQLDQMNNEEFNGVSLFAMNGGPPSNNGTKGIVAYQKTDGTPGTYQKFGRTIQADPGSSENTISINVINLEHVISYDSLDPTKVQVNAAGWADRITDFSVSLMMVVVERIADARAENGAEQNRLMQVMEFLEVNYTNMEAAHGRIMDTDIAAESTRFARNNVLVQSGAAMTAQANQLTKIVLSLIN